MFCLIHFEASGHTILIEMTRGEILGSRYSNSRKRCSCKQCSGKQDDCWDVFEECKKNMKSKIRHVTVAVYKELEMS